MALEQGNQEDLRKITKEQPQWNGTEKRIDNDDRDTSLTKEIEEDVNSSNEEEKSRVDDPKLKEQIGMLQQLNRMYEDGSMWNLSEKYREIRKDIEDKLTKSIPQVIPSEMPENMQEHGMNYFKENPAAAAAFANELVKNPESAAQIKDLKDVLNNFDLLGLDKQQIVRDVIRQQQQNIQKIYKELENKAE